MALNSGERSPQYEGGRGKVVLLVGKGFSEGILKITTDYMIQKQNFNVSVYSGGDKPGHIQLFAGGGSLPDYFDESSIVNLPGILGIIVQKHNLNVHLQDDDKPESAQTE